MEIDPMEDEHPVVYSLAIQSRHPLTATHITPYSGNHAANDNRMIGYKGQIRGKAQAINDVLDKVTRTPH
eukprot:168924-Hanusia_phi.AAC.1